VRFTPPMWFTLGLPSVCSYLGHRVGQTERCRGEPDLDGRTWYVAGRANGDLDRQQICNLGLGPAASPNERRPPSMRSPPPRSTNSLMSRSWGWAL
jgi:hypothetical protein